MSIPDPRSVAPTDPIVAKVPRRQGRTSRKDAANGTLDVDLMLFFHAVAETLSFTKAAQRLGISRDTLRYRIKKYGLG